MINILFVYIDFLKTANCVSFNVFQFFVLNVPEGDHDRSKHVRP
jgi:hypothetical protein